VVCYRPIKAYYGDYTKNGKRSIVFNHSKSLRGEKIELPCGKCIGCKQERARQWSIRCMHECYLHQENCFITLTYNDEHMPKNGSLNTEDFQKFMKRLRRRYEGKKIRFFHCGEYGDKFSRPHHHAIIFGVQFPDVRTHLKNGVEIRNPINILQELWSDKKGNPIGHVYSGEATKESCAYVAGYIQKKINGKRAREHYAEIDKSSGEILYERKPEHITMSRNPGIGNKWFEKYKSDIFPCDSVVIDGIKMRVPKYYEKLLDKENKEEYNLVKEKRKDVPEVVRKNRTEERLKVKEKIHKARLKLFKKRRYESE
jgi:hypothetical protein